MRWDSNSATVIGSRNMRISTNSGSDTVSFVVIGCALGSGVVLGGTLVSWTADTVVVVDIVAIMVGAGMVVSVFCDVVEFGDIVEFGDVVEFVVVVVAGGGVVVVVAGAGVVVVVAGADVVVVVAGDVVVVVVLMVGRRVHSPLPSTANVPEEHG